LGLDFITQKLVILKDRLVDMVTTEKAKLTI
jgi:hypothetical protein